MVDQDLGNLVKATRFGWVVRAKHGGRFLGHDEIRSAYLGAHIDLSDDRYIMLNSLFSLSEASLFAQGVELLDAGKLPGGIGYREVFAAVGRNDPCPCGSGLKFKRCHGDRPLPTKTELDSAVARVSAG